LVERGQFERAIEMDRALRHQAEKEILAALEDAWRSVRATDIGLTRVAEAPKESGIDEWTAGLGFDEHGALIKRGLLTRRITFEGKKTSSEVVVDRGLPITDLEGRHAVEALVKDCASVRARIVTLDPETGAVRLGTPRREVQIAPAD